MFGRMRTDDAQRMVTLASEVKRLRKENAELRAQVAPKPFIDRDPCIDTETFEEYMTDSDIE